MPRIELLDREELAFQFSPHPMAFRNYYVPWVLLLVWGFIHPTLAPDVLGQLGHVVIWGAGVVLIGVAASVAAIRSIYAASTMAMIVLSLVLMVVQDEGAGVLPIVTVGIGLVGVVGTEVWRRRHSYYVTSIRIVTSEGFFSTRTRSLRYGQITDLRAERGHLGHLLGYGNIVPVTQSGFGLGTDMAVVGAAVRGPRIPFFGRPLLGAGGGRSVSTARAHSGDSLVGAHPFGPVHRYIEERTQAHQQVTLMHEQTEALGRIESVLRRGVEVDDD